MIHFALVVNLLWKRQPLRVEMSRHLTFMVVQQRRPRDEMEEILLHNTRDANGAWVGETFRKGDWIFLQPSAMEILLPL